MSDSRNQKGKDGKIRTAIGPWGAVPVAFVSDPGISFNMLKVYSVLSSYQGRNDKCWPSRKEISEAANLPEPGVSKAISQLVAAGWVERIRRPHRHATNMYRVLFDIPNVSKNRTFDSSEYSNDSHSECTNDSDIPHSTKTPTDNTNLALAAPKGLKPMKDEVSNMWQEALVSIEPDSAWSSYGKERKALVMLGEQTKKLYEDTHYQSHADVIEDILREYRRARDTAKTDYWRHAPFTPSAVMARWSDVVTRLADRHHSDSTEVLF